MAATAKWNPRGPQTWPEWRKAVPEVTRVEHVRSGRRGTFVRWPRTHRGRTPGYATIRWDGVPGVLHGKPITGRVVAFAFDLRVVA
jgi:hypothetical protein